MLFLGGLIDGREEEGRGRFFNISFFFSPLFHLSLLISLSPPCLIPWHERFLELTEAGEEPV